MVTAFKRRPYQQEQLDCTKKDYDAGINRLLAVAATGTGKTEYFCQLPTVMGLGGQTVILVHRDELAQQAAKKYKKRNPKAKIGIEMGTKHYASPDDDIIVASVQTLGRDGSKRIQRFDKDKVRLVITDEAHHATAATYISVYEYFDMLVEGSKKLLVGVTATPGRSDGVALAKVFSKVTHNYPLRQAIEEGYLCDIRAIRLKTGTDISKVKSSAGDFQLGDLSNAINTPERNQQIVKSWKEHASDRPTIAFTADIQHAKDLAAMFDHYGIAAEAVWGNDPDRGWKLARHQGPEGMRAYCIENELLVPSDEDMEALRIQVLCNCGVLTEGYDDWRVSCVIMARPTKSQTLFVQCVGRGTRLQEGVDNLKVAIAEGWALEKKDCLIIDVVDSTMRNSLVTVPSIFGMGGEVDLKGQSAVKTVKILEAAQEEHPTVDFSQLGSIDDIDAIVEAADIWNVKFPEEVTNNSEMSWHRLWDGSYFLGLPSEEKGKPSKDEVTIRENALGKWEIAATIRGQKFKGVRDTLEEAFQAADNLIITKAGHAIKILKREEEWHDEPITDGQVRMLKRLLKGQPIPAGISKGQASKRISQLLAGKVTGKAA